MALDKRLKVYCNGKFIDEDQPCIPVKDRGFLFGDGVFTTIKVVDGNVQYIDQHLERLQNQCLALNIDYPIISLDDIHLLISKNDAHVGVWKLKIMITGGECEDLTLPFRQSGKVLMTKIKSLIHDRKKLLRLTVFPYPVAYPIAKIKTLAYLNRLWIAEYAKAQGYDDAIILSAEGFVLETGFSNLFWVIEDHFFTPTPELDFLMGIELKEQIKHYQRNGYKIHFVKEKLEDIPSEAKIYICNCIKGVVSVVL